MQTVQELTAEQRDLTAQLRKDFSQETIDKLANLQVRLREAQGIEDATRDDTAGGEAQVTLIRGGKDDQTLMVPTGTNLETVLEQLGWSQAGMEFKRMVGPGMTEVIKDPKAAVMGAGAHEILVMPKVVGG